MEGRDKDPDGKKAQLGGMAKTKKYTHSFNQKEKHKEKPGEKGRTTFKNSYSRRQQQRNQDDVNTQDKLSEPKNMLPD